MKSKIMVILAMLLLITLAGCNNTRQKEQTPEAYSSSESSEKPSEPDTLPAEEETSEVEKTPEPMQSTEPAEAQSAAEVRGTESSEPKATEQTAKPTSTSQETAPQKTESETVQTAKPETETTPPPAPLAQTETAESTPPQETTPEPKSIYDYEFDIAAICAEMIAVGEGMGLTHTEGLTPDTASWSIPVTASPDFQGENLKRRLTDYVQSMPGLIMAYGGEPIQSFTIYAEPLGGGSYRFYFLY